MTEEKQGLKQSLGLYDATMLVAGSMIGSGVFIVAADMTRTLGSMAWVLCTWVITGIITIIAALSYGELAGMMPKAGGQYVYLQRAYHPLVAFTYGWTVFTVIQTGVIAAVAVAFAKFTAVFFPILSVDNILYDGFIKVSAGQLFAILSIFFLTFINTQGVQNGKLIQTLFTSAKIIALLALIIMGLVVGLQSSVLVTNFSEYGWAAVKLTKEANGSITSEPLTGIAFIIALGAASVGSLFSSDAWNNVTFIAGEIKAPQKNIPLSLFFGTLVVTILYVLANLAYMAVLPLDAIAFADYDRVGTAAVHVILGSIGVYLMAALIMISTFGCNNGLILAGARLFYAMANDGLFFKKAGALNKKAVPEFALWLQCFWAAALCLSGTYGDLLDYTTFVSLIFYIITIGGVIVLRFKEPHTERPYRVLAYPFLPILYMIVATIICILLMIAKPANTNYGLMIVAMGIPAYYITKIFTSHKA